MVVISDGGNIELEVPYESYKQDYEPFGWKILEDKRIPKEDKVIAKDTKEATETIVENKKEDKEIKKKK